LLESPYYLVIPAQAGIFLRIDPKDPGLRRDDEFLIPEKGSSATC
jgi:hypothetical protein